MRNKFDINLRDMLKSLRQFLLVGGSFVLLFSCRSDDGLASEYMPDMYRSPSVETYVDYNHIDSISARLPVKGTIPRGFSPYPYKNTSEGYEQAGKELTYGIPKNKKNIEEGKVLFKMFCVHCHGKKGDGMGILAQRDKFPPVPTKFNKNLILPVGKMFHTITYGKGLMGAHAHMLSKKERWQLIHYIENQFKVNSKATEK